VPVSGRARIVVWINHTRPVAAMQKMRRDARACRSERRI
jgi:hypothetical protein